MMTAMMNPPREAERAQPNMSAAEEGLRKIEQQIEESILYHTALPDAAISRRICALEREWSMERWLETNGSALALSGVVLGLTVNRKWFALSLLASGFLFQHAVRGCPPVAALRKLGVRSRAEIEREKNALKSLRGDFEEVASATVETEGEKVLAAVNA